MSIKTVKTTFSWIAYECNVWLAGYDFLSLAYEGYTTLKLVSTAASKAFSNSLNDLSTFGQPNLKEHSSQRSSLENRISL